MRAAHYTLVNHITILNVSNGITRHGHPDFGHPYLNIIDDIQKLEYEIFGMDPWPKHVNASNYKVFPNFSPLGVGELTIDKMYTEAELPETPLSVDLQFIADRQKLPLPLLPVATKEEHKLYNTLLRQWSVQSTVRLNFPG